MKKNIDYLYIKKKLKTVLPSKIFDILIFTWRLFFVKILHFNRNRKLRKFKSPFFKKISIWNINSFHLKISPYNWYIDRVIYLENIYEKNIFMLMSVIIKEWDTCVDIWANIWMYTNFLPKIVWTQWKVIWFEPIKRIYIQNQESIKYNHYWKNVVLYNSACWYHKKQSLIHICPDNVWGSSLYKQKCHTEWTTEKINTVIWDEILSTENKINFIKIDTEWYELNVLKGLKKTIYRFKPYIIIEFSPTLFEKVTDSLEILTILKTNYHFVYIIEHKVLLNLELKLDEIKYQKLANEKQVNLFFFNNKSLVKTINNL